MSVLYLEIFLWMLLGLLGFEYSVGWDNAPRDLSISLWAPLFWKVLISHNLVTYQNSDWHRRFSPATTRWSEAVVVKVRRQQPTNFGEPSPSCIYEFKALEAVRSGPTITKADKISMPRHFVVRRRGSRPFLLKYEWITFYLCIYRIGFSFIPYLCFKRWIIVFLLTEEEKASQEKGHEKHRSLCLTYTSSVSKK